MVAAADPDSSLSPSNSIDTDSVSYEGPGQGGVFLRCRINNVY